MLVTMINKKWKIKPDQNNITNKKTKLLKQKNYFKKQHSYCSNKIIYKKNPKIIAATYVLLCFKNNPSIRDALLKHV